jgi:hypothetical membrane protein
MKKLDKYITFFFNIIPGGIFGLLSLSFAILFVFLSYLHFPGYDIMTNDVSILGIGPGLSAPLFNNGIKIIGISAIPFFIYFGKVLRQEAENTKYIKSAVRLSIGGCISLSLIGFFPVVNRTMSVIHAGLALIFFLCSIINLICFSRTILKDQRFSNIHAYHGFIIAGLIAFYIAVRWSIVEWIVFFALGFWLADNSFYTLYKKFKL